MVKPVVVSVWIYKRFLLMLPPSPFVCNVATTFMAFVGKAIGNVTGLDKFPHCYIPTASQHAPPLARTEKPVVVMSLAHTQLLLSQVHTTLTNDLNEIGNVVSALPSPYPHCKERMIL